jgi:hypothetical protein
MKSGTYYGAAISVHPCTNDNVLEVKDISSLSKHHYIKNHRSNQWNPQNSDYSEYVGINDCENKSTKVQVSSPLS